MSKIHLKPGNTIADGYKTYVMRNSGRIEYVSSGAHAEYHVSGAELMNLFFRENAVKPLVKGFETLGLIFTNRYPRKD